MRKQFIAGCFLALIHSPFSFAFSESSQTSLTHSHLNGVSIYEELRRKYFVTELYTSVPVHSITQLHEQGGEVQLEIKFLREMPTNKFSQLWVRGAVINNSDALIIQEKANLDAFAGTFTNSFKAGDSVVLHFDGETNMSIFYNKRLLATYASLDLMGVLLNAVAGDVPLSSSFKRELFAGGQVDRELKAITQQLQLKAASGDLSVAQN
ncbi:chalcone isomerase family protein [Aurantivibrio plasticivorans]